MSRSLHRKGSAIPEGLAAGASPRPPADVALPLPELPPRFLEPAGFAWGRHVAADGAALRWGHYAATATHRADCVLVNGFTEFIEKYFETVRDLAARGLSVWCLDWRGQGGSARPAAAPTRPRRRDYDGDAADLAGFVDAVLPPRRPRLLVAHSMGGAMAMVALRRRPELFDAAVLSAPMLGIAPAYPPKLARMVAQMACLAGLGDRRVPGAREWRVDPNLSPANSRTTSDPERVRIQPAWFTARPELRVDGPTYGWLASAFAAIDRVSDPRHLAAITTPILLGSAGIEVFVDRRAHHRLSPLLPDCTLFEMPDSKHEPFLERDEIRDRWLAAIDRFLSEKLPAGG